MNEQNGQKTLDVSWETIFKFFIVIICAYLVFVLRDILIWILFALIISTLFAPIIDFWQQKKVPRVISSLFIYIVIFGLLGLLIYLIIPPLVSEVQDFSRSLPQYLERISPFLRQIGAFEDIENFMIFLGERLEQIVIHIFRTVAAIFGGVSATVFIIAVSFFFSLEEKPVQKFIKIIFPKKYEEQVLSLWTKSQKSIINWFWARILTCLFVGIVTLFVLLLFDVRYSFILALMVGISNFIVFLGPIIAGFIMFLFIVLESISKAIFVLIAFILIQQIESSLVQPILMKKAVGMSPAMVLIALVVGGTLWGILGAILAIPLFGLLFDFFKGFFEIKKQGETKLTQNEISQENNLG